MPNWPWPILTYLNSYILCCTYRHNWFHAGYSVTLLQSFLGNKISPWAVLQWAPQILENFKEVLRKICTQKYLMKFCEKLRIKFLKITRKTWENFRYFRKVLIKFCAKLKQFWNTLTEIVNKFWRNNMKILMKLVKIIGTINKILDKLRVKFTLIFWNFKGNFPKFWVKFWK